MANILLLALEVALGILLALAIPATKLAGMGGIESTAKWLSPYIFGVGLVVTIGSAGTLLGLAFRFVLAKVFPAFRRHAGSVEWKFPAICGFAGSMLLSWYCWSYVYAAYL